MKDFNYQLNHANLLKVESEPDLPVSSDENMQTYKGKLKFSDTVNTFIQAIMSSDSFKFSSIPLQQQIQHLSFIINMWTISSSEYLLDIITEEHVKLMVRVWNIYIQFLLITIVKLREREGQRVDLGRSLKCHLWMVDDGWWISFP